MKNVTYEFEAYSAGGNPNDYTYKFNNWKIKHSRQYQRCQVFIRY